MSDMKDDPAKLANELRICAGMIEMGERIAHGRDADLMRQAAETIEDLLSSCRSWEAQSKLKY